jgi:hypothetical protein
MKKTLLTKLFLFCFIAFTTDAFSQGWTGLGTGVTNGFVNAVVVWNGNVYVAGSFTAPASNIAMWNGTSWSALGTGTNGEVKALCVYNNELYAGGTFTTAGGTTVNHIAKWNGSWSIVGSASGTDQAVYCMTVFNSTLFVGGAFLNAGGGSAHYAGIWNGSTWATAGTELGAAALCFGVHSSILYAGLNGGAVLVKWSGTAWSAVSPTLSSGQVYSLASYSNNLYVSGLFSISAGPNTFQNIAKWTGSTWSSVGANAPLTASFYAYTMKVFSGYLWVGGGFLSANSVSNTRSLARWNGSTWSTAYVSPSPLDNTVRSLDTGVVSSTTYIFAVGEFTTPYARVMKGVTDVGVEELAMAEGVVSVYPNPAHGRVNIHVNSEIKNPSLEVYNMVGEKVYSAAVRTDIETINTTGLASGIYFVKVFSEKKGNIIRVSTQKIVIE